MIFFGRHCRGRIELGWTFAILAAAQVVLAVMNYLISKKNK